MMEDPLEKIMQVNFGVNASIKRHMLEAQEHWRDWVKTGNDPERRIPAIPMKAHWKMTPLPPFAGALARFVIETDKGGWVSVYLDVDDNLGCVGEPYWEVMPATDTDEPDRCLLDEVDKLVGLIDYGLSQREYETN